MNGRPINGARFLYMSKKVFNKISMAHIVDVWYKNGEDYSVLIPGQMAPFYNLTHRLGSTAGLTVYSGAHCRQGSSTGNPVDDTVWCTNVQNETASIEEAAGYRRHSILGYGSAARTYILNDGPAGLSLAQPINGWERTVQKRNIPVGQFAQTHIRARCTNEYIRTKSGNPRPVVPGVDIVPVIFCEATPEAIAFVTGADSMAFVDERWDAASGTSKSVVRLPLPVLLQPFDTMMHERGYSHEQIKQLAVRYRMMVDSLMRKLRVAELYVGASEDALLGICLEKRYSRAEFAELFINADANDMFCMLQNMPPSTRRWYNTPLVQGDVIMPLDGESRAKVIQALRNRAFVCETEGWTLL